MKNHPLIGAQAYQGREVAGKLGLNATQTKQFVKIYLGLAQMFVDCDLAMIEVGFGGPRSQPQAPW